MKQTLYIRTKTIVILAICIIVFLINGIFLDDFFLEKYPFSKESFFPFIGISPMIYSVIIIFWNINCRKHIINKRILRVLNLMSYLLLLYMCLRTLLYYFADSVTYHDIFQRYFFYGFYVCAIPFSYLSFCAATNINTIEKEKIPVYKYILSTITCVLIVLVLTNDYHNLFYTFDTLTFFDINTTEQFRGPLWILIEIWMVLFAALSVMVGIMKTMAQKNRKYIWIPLIPIAIGLVYQIYCLINVEKHFFSQADMYFFMVIIHWECLGLIRAVPKNDNYEDLFTCTSVRSAIVDNNGNAIYKSKEDIISASDFLRQIIENQPYVFNNQKLISNKISGGNFIYSIDMSNIIVAKKRLIEGNNNLNEYNDILIKENEELKKKEFILTQKNLYDKLFFAVKDDFSFLNARLKEIDPTSDNYIASMKNIAICGSFIKRILNLILIKETNEYISIKDLDYSIYEVLDYIKERNALVSYFSKLKVDVKADAILSLFNALKEIIKYSMPNIDCIAVYMQSNSDDSLTMKVFIENYSHLFTGNKDESITINIENNLDESITYIVTTKGGVIKNEI